MLAGNNITSVLASGLHFEHNGLPGKVIIAAQSVSQDGNNIFRVPFRDSRLSSSTGSYPYSLDGNSKAVVYLQNVANTARKYTVQIDYEGGSYVLGVKHLQAKEVIAYDIRKIRDEQTPDIYGNTIPLYVTGGKAYWSLNGKGDRDIIGRIEQADVVSGLSSTSACGRCCMNSTIEVRLTPYAVIGFIGDTNPFTAVEYDRDCYGNDLYPFATEYNVTFSSSDTSVATINSSGVATGVGVGSTTISALVEAFTYTNCTAEDAGDEYCCDENNAPMNCDASCDIRPPIVTIDPINSIEVNTTKTTIVHVSKNGSSNTLIVSLAAPQGQPQRATFEDGSTTKTISGGNGDFSYTIKGVLASEQTNDFNIRVFPQRSQGGGSYAVAMFTVTSVIFSQAANCTGFDDTISDQKYLSVPKNGSNTVKAKIIPNGASGNFNFQAQNGITVSPTSISSSEQTLTITGGNNVGTFTLQALANQATQAAATLNAVVLARINKTVIIHAITEDVTGTSPNSANIPSDSSLQDYLNDITWGKQANVYFTVTRDTTSHRVDFDLNRNSLLENIPDTSEINVISAEARITSYNINLYYQPLDISTYSSTGTEAFTSGTQSWFSQKHKDSPNNLAAHEIGHAIGRSGHI